MFDFGFTELMVIGVVLLIVVGPERLPKVARTAGHLLGRVQRYVSDVKSDIQREMQLEELKKLQEQVKQQAQELESSVRSGVSSIESEVGRTTEELRSMLPDGAAAGPNAAEALSGNQLLAQDRAAKADDGPQLELGLDSSARPGSTADKTQA
ncbi:MAG TPA: Sec-independent protein translocase protein TatB [Thauera sp.]|uniref:Sec-independent protein translocase protein TatB n=1 Tax=Thauera sp. TaxID=1905334 RepID=UPI002B6F1B3C|nr:Sec-independent protein translocase protein TatB [Thauera sp.]HRP25130.1 Sec-independent protein translocase protein TatB [Thauera sp.]HRP66568.1 Sec-independent protein translocase protein TatB [Thauera sp.]